MSSPVDFQQIPPARIIEKLQPLVTAERWEKITRIAAQRWPSVSLVLEDIYDRGNASAVMRTAEAFGFYQFHMIELNDRFKESQRVTQGAHKWLRIKKWSSTADCVKALKDQGQKIYVTHLDPKARPLPSIDLSHPFALCFGNEKDGASEELLKLSDERVFIPMRGFVQSFNISVAAAICLYDIQNRLPAAPENPRQTEDLIAYYLTRSVDQWQKHFPAGTPG